MVKTYDFLRDGYNRDIPGLTKLFIISTLSDGSISRFESGAFVPSQAGTLFIVDDWLIPQIDKLLFINGELKVKDGETIEAPEKSEYERQEEALLQQLAELRAKKSGSAE